VPKGEKKERKQTHLLLAVASLVRLVVVLLTFVGEDEGLLVLLARRSGGSVMVKGE
jgi:hypothetical protein